jgi:hypothetical protein
MKKMDNSDMHSDANSELLIKSEFPIDSQTIKMDKLVLLKIRKVLQALPSYSYLEIGSFMGGSLTPFLKDPQCEHILSVDERGREQPDERGYSYDYSGITHQTMIDNLTNHNFDVRKLKTFDGSVSGYIGDTYKFDLMFIDGEHTDGACFRDFIHGIKLLKEDSIVLFHDSSLIYKSLQIIQEYLISTGRRFKFLKINDSEMSCLFLNNFCSLNHETIFSSEKNLSKYYTKCEKKLFFENLMSKLTLSLLAKYFIARAIPRSLLPFAQKLNQTLKTKAPQA